MTRIYELADTYVEQWAALNPTVATSFGITGYDTEMTDFSPAGADARAALYRATLRDLQHAPVEGERDRIARTFLEERLAIQLEQYAQRTHVREVRVLFGPLQSVRQCFDLMPRDTEEAWETIAVRLTRVPEALQSYRASLEEGLPGAHGRASTSAGVGGAGSGLEWRACGHRGLLPDAGRRIHPARAQHRSTPGGPGAWCSRRRRGLRADGPLPAGGVRPARNGARRRWCRAVCAGCTLQQRARPGPHRDLRLGVGRAGTHRDRDSPKCGAHRPRRRC